MRKIGVRQFQQNFHKELKDLPFVVTKDGNDYCVVTPLTAINDIAKMLRPENVTTPVTTTRFPGVKEFYEDEPEEIGNARETGRCNPQNDSCKNLGYPYVVTYPTDEGEETKEYFLCDNHLASARKKYRVREI